MGRTPCALWELQHCNNFNSIVMKNLTPRNRRILCREPSLWTWCHGLMWVHWISTGAAFYKGETAVVCNLLPDLHNIRYNMRTEVTRLMQRIRQYGPRNVVICCREEIGPHCPDPIFNNFVFYLKYQLQCQGLLHCYAGPCSIDSVHWCGHHIMEFLKKG
jgi:hypothetical protein